MQSLQRLAQMSIPMKTVRAIARLNECKGRQELYQTRFPEVLRTLQDIAIIQSTESSNRLEGIRVPDRKLRQLMEQKALPTTRSEAEISGYRDVLATIHTSALAIPVRPGTILQLHRDLYKYLPQEGGKWKPADNYIREILTDGSERVRFTPVPAFQVPTAVEDLCYSFVTYRAKGELDDLLLIFACILDFLCIHPFSDGNGRMSRLLTLLLLYQAGFEVGRFISLERIIEESKETYYDALYRSSQGWHQGEHDLLPWLDYSLGTLLAAYKELEEHVHLVQVPQRGSKSALVRQAVLHFYSEEFSFQDVARACPNVSRPTITRVLDSLKEEGLIECVVGGRHARWRFRPHPGGEADGGETQGNGTGLRR